MPWVYLLAFLALEVDYSAICEYFGFVFDDTPIWMLQIAGIFHRTYLKGLFGITVSMLTGNWEGITPSAIFYCVSAKVLNFLMLLAGTKLDMVFCEQFL